jgi:hypothetical protein
MIFTPGLFSISSDLGNTDLRGLTLVTAASSIVVKGGILSRLSAGVVNLLVRFTFSPLLGK